MKNALELIIQIINENQLVSATFSSPRSKGEDLKSVGINPTSDEKTFKVELKYLKHNNLVSVSAQDLVTSELANYLTQFKQVLIKGHAEEIQILLNKKGQAKIIRKKSQVPKANKHNRQKDYLIPDNEKCPFLIEIGVMDKNGKVKSNYYKKFRQINRFLQMVDDLFRDQKQETYHIVDFGCGKSYLTFALYHYFTVIKQGEVKITGIDLKQEVIDHCNEKAQNLKFTHLKFAHGFIHNFKTDDPVDFVVTLHACDTATDDAIVFSLKQQAKYMMFVPCCQHELNKQITNSDSNIMLKHGIMKDRMTALVTDTMRSQLLEYAGYKVQVMEFIDLEHTAKNILLRCTKTNRDEQQTQSILQNYQSFKQQWKITPYLEKRLTEEGLYPLKEIN